MRQTGKASGSHPAATRAWSAVIVVASVTGGLVAAAVGGASWVTALGVSVVIGAAVAVLAVPLGWPVQAAPSIPADRERQAVPGASGAVGSPSGRPQRRDRPAADPAPENGTGAGEVIRVMPLAARTPAAGTEWWQQTGTPAAQDTTAEREPALPLSSYLDSGVVVQCPRCGSFLADVRQGAADWTFDCQECGNRWTWRSGTPWPSVAVRPRLRGENRPPPRRRDSRA